MSSFYFSPFWESKDSCAPSPGFQELMSFMKGPSVNTLDLHSTALELAGSISDGGYRGREELMLPLAHAGGLGLVPFTSQSQNPPFSSDLI